MSPRRTLLALALIVVAFTTCTSDDEAAAPRASISPTPAPVTSAAPATPTPRPSDSAPDLVGVYAGFQPVSVTAISSDHFWMLGDAPCDKRLCTSIVTTRNGGRNSDYVGIPPPRAPLSFELDHQPRGVRELRFASENDGFAYGPDLYVTHDNGQTWTRSSLEGRVLTLEAASGRAYAIVNRSGRPALMTSSVEDDDWTPLKLPGDAAPLETSLTVHGSSLWLTGGGADLQRHLFHSVDQGETFDSGPSPCTAHLGASFSAVGESTLWAMCPTGMQAQVLRSTDEGGTFSPVRTPAIANSSVIGAATKNVVFVGSACTPLLRVDSHGRSKEMLGDRCGGTSKNWSFVGFTDRSHGFAIRFSFSHELRSELWRTTDGGAGWTRINFPGD